MVWAVKECGEKFKSILKRNMGDVSVNGGVRGLVKVSRKLRKFDSDAVSDLMHN